MCVRHLVVEMISFDFRSLFDNDVSHISKLYRNIVAKFMVDYLYFAAPVYEKDHHTLYNRDVSIVIIVRQFGPMSTRSFLLFSFSVVSSL